MVTLLSHKKRTKLARIPPAPLKEQSTTPPKRKKLMILANKDHRRMMRV